MLCKATVGHSPLVLWPIDPSSHWPPLSKQNSIHVTSTTMHALKWLNFTKSLRSREKHPVTTTCQYNFWKFFPHSWIQARKLGKCDSYLWNLKWSITHWAGYVRGGSIPNQRALHQLVKMHVIEAVLDDRSYWRKNQKVSLKEREMIRSQLMTRSLISHRQKDAIRCVFEKGDSSWPSVG